MSIIQLIGILLLIPIIIVTFVYFVTILAVKLLGILKTKTIVLIMVALGLVGISMIILG